MTIKAAKTTAATEYTEDQQPCIVAKKPCGCYIAAFGLDESDLGKVGQWNTDQDIDRPELFKFLKLDGVSFEMRPVSFVRSGGLTFDCRHK